MTVAIHDATPTNLDHQVQYAERMAVASLAPDVFKRQPANVLVALAIAADMSESIWTVMSEMAVIGGKPSFSAKFMRARVRKAGHRLRESFENGVARCVIIRSDDPSFEHVAEWDEAKAKQHGYWGKGHWAKNPELMLKNRALSECVREACYEVMGGVGYTPDEVADFAPTRVEQVAAQTAPQSLADVVAAQDWQARVAAASSADELNSIWGEAKASGELDADLKAALAARNEALKATPTPEVDAETGEVYEAELLLDEPEPRP